MNKPFRFLTNIFATLLCGVLIALIATPLMIPKEMQIQVDFSSASATLNAHDDVIAHPMTMDKKSGGQMERLLKPQYDGDVKPAIFTRRSSFELELSEI